MGKRIPSYLALHDDGAIGSPPDADLSARFDELCEAFTAATGWPLKYIAQADPGLDPDLMWSAPVNPGVGATPGHLRMDLADTGANADVLQIDFRPAQRLASALARTMSDWLATREALWRREAELAVGVPVVSRPDEPTHLAARLEAVLKAGADALDCQAAALYLLDDATSELKLRSSFGLLRDRLTQPARPLAGAIADLEALLGHAVALEGSSSWEPWNVPEPAAAALCVPVSSPTVPLGTLWFYCDSQRDFTPAQTNIAEVIAGRLAADLERTAMLSERLASRGSAF